MPLSAGTAFQHGQYVIDAYCHSDSLGELYLATAIASGQTVLIRVLPGDTSAAPEPVQAYQRHIQRLAHLDSPGIVPALTSFVEASQAYLVMAANIGVPLATLIPSSGPIDYGTAAKIVQQVTATLQAIGEPGWRGLTLDPQHIWWQPQTQQPYLSGFQLFSDDQPPSVDEGHWGPTLAGLLFYLLVGESIHDTQAPLVHFHQQRPELSHLFEPLLQQGLQPTADFSLGAWERQLTEILPARDSAMAMNAPTLPQPAPQPQPVAAPKTSKRPLALLATAFIAGIGGLAFALTLRLQPSEVADRNRFDPEQDFPPLSDWPSTSDEWFDPAFDTDWEEEYVEPDWSTEELTSPSPPVNIAPVEAEPEPPPSVDALSPADELDASFESDLSIDPESVPAPSMPSQPTIAPAPPQPSASPSPAATPSAPSPIPNAPTPGTGADGGQNLMPAPAPPENSSSDYFSPNESLAASEPNSFTPRGGSME